MPSHRDVYRWMLPVLAHIPEAPFFGLNIPIDNLHSRITSAVWTGQVSRLLLDEVAPAISHYKGRQSETANLSGLQGRLTLYDGCD